MSTKDRLLEVAIRMFASSGYEKTTIADICSEAEANIAAVNYHFGSKEHLYIEVWKAAFADAIARHPADGGVPADAPVEDCFRGRIRAVISRITDPTCLEVDIMAKEISDQTGILHETVHRAIGPFRQAMIATIAELLDCAPTEELVHLCAMSVMSQSMHLMIMRTRPMSHPPPDDMPQPPPAQLADHIVEFSLAALRSLRRKRKAESTVEHHHASN